ncbi:MAG: hypothetical protein ABI234_17160 [Ktedonobacteraceae bacterium]
MNESITRAADGEFGQELPPAQMEAIISSIGRIPFQRTTRNRLCSLPASAMTALLNRVSYSKLFAVCNGNVFVGGSMFCGI